MFAHVMQIWVALTCQEDLDIFIELEKCNRSSRLGFNIRVFPKPAEISSPEVSLYCHRMHNQLMSMVCTCM